MYGEHSRCLPSGRALQHRLPAATMDELPGAGHFFPASRPAYVAGVIARFLGEPDGQEASAVDSAKEAL